VYGCGSRAFAFSRGRGCPGLARDGAARPETNSHVYTLDRTFHCLVDGCAAWGLGRNQFLIYGGTSDQEEPYGADNILRRLHRRRGGTHRAEPAARRRGVRGVPPNFVGNREPCLPISAWTLSS
jgi:hypothetical protein